MLWFVLTALCAIGSFVAALTVGFLAPVALTAAAVLASVIGIVVSIGNRRITARDASGGAA